MPTVGATVCDIAPLSLQLPQTYWMPVPPLCGEVAAIGWLEPETQLKVCAVVYAVPSTVKERPDGFGCTVTEMFTGLTVKLAVSVIGPFIVTEAGLLFPEYEPGPLPVQPVNL